MKIEANIIFFQPEQRNQPEIIEDENRSWSVSPSDRMIFRAKAESGGEMETTLTVTNRCLNATHFPALFSEPF